MIVEIPLLVPASTKGKDLQTIHKKTRLLSLSKLEASLLNLLIIEYFTILFRVFCIKPFPFVAGAKITEFNDRNGVNTQVFDLYAENDMLLVPSWCENSVSCYELKY